MEPQENQRTSNISTWLLLAGVFVAAIIVTVVIGTRDDNSTENDFPDLGDIAEADPNLPSSGDLAPTFTVATVDGGTFDLATHLAEDGRPVVLNLWASWCPPCRAEMPAIDTSANQHPEVAFVGVSVKDTAAEARAFVNEIGISYIIGLDDGSVDEAYPSLGLPATFYIGADGTLVKTHVGPVTVDLLNDEIAELFGH